METTYRRDPLRRPPLVEALFEVRVETEVAYSLVPGHLNAALGPEYGTVLELVPQFMLDIPSPPSVVFHRFESRDKKRLIQCGPKVLTANVLDDYGAYESFEELIKLAFTKYVRAAKPTRISRLGMRYINLIDDDIAAGAWPFSVNVTQPSSLSTKSVQTTIRQTYKDLVPSGQLAVAIAKPAELGSGRKGALLDLDCFNENPPQTAEEIYLWARNAHDGIYQVFRSYIEPVYGRLKERS